MDCLNKLREDIHKLASQISNNEQTVNFKKEQQTEAKEDIGSAAVEITCMTEEVEGLSLQIADQRQKLSETSKEINNQETVLEKTKEESEQKRDGL